MTPAALHDALKQRFGERYSTAAAILERHGKDEAYHAGVPPEAVVFATSTEDVVEVVNLCRAHKAPLIPFGTGTSLEGHINAIRGGISLDLSLMTEVLEVNEEDLDCRVQAGVTRKALNEHLRATGLMFPIDPGADASLGGMTATRASGTNAVRYGTMKDNVLGLTVVMANGDVVRTGGRAPKSSAGYDLTRLMIGSEGTLGVITEIQLKLYGQPEAVSAAVCLFPDIDAAAKTAIMVKQMGIPVARMELVDGASIRAINEADQLGMVEKPHIFFEFHGTEAWVAEQAERTQEIAAELGGEDFEWSTRPEDRTRLWNARHNMFYSVQRMRPGSVGWPTDVCVPISRLADCINQTLEDLSQTNLLAPLVGHVGDGNFHLQYLIDPNNEDELSEARWVNSRMIERAIEMGGTCTGEHGVGHGKIKYLEAEHGAPSLAVMASIKRALDPENIMNPGKILSIN
ncbi:MAG: FAD-binding protein [Alphaproteobacteria bacterium]|nr:FAD-binding protein [Alphaproteobacteria bacterium]MEC8155276.1 FAD-linked oxidase C-terminal domain-containing protein [Pseudomonadota bacterium]HCI01168.1 FAD-binding oxidoreductase [Alphaproteobacteria bacterium]